jgi:formamidopyrimidine-DNA glycosylase
MPELPEVETLTRAFDAALRRRRVDSVAVRSIAALKTHDPAPAALVGLRVSGTRRWGKFIDMEIPPYHLIIHLARAGWLRLRRQPTQTRSAMGGPLALVLTFDDGSALEATEQGTEKRLAVYVVTEPADVPGIARLGIDALDEALTMSKLGEILRGQPGTLKNVLADQAVIAGIGNAYSDEILHSAKLSPFKRASALSETELKALRAAMREVLTDAVERARAVDITGLKADKKMHMRVHGRAGEKCPVCRDTIREVSLSTRSFQYCPTCQTGGRVYADRRMSRLLR